MEFYQKHENTSDIHGIFYMFENPGQFKISVCVTAR